jgi:hydrogenase-4 component B
VSLPQLSSPFSGWYCAGILLLSVAALIGLLCRGGASRLLALLVGSGCLFLVLAALENRDSALRLPLPWFLGSAGFELVSDPLSRWFLAIIGLVGGAVALFSPGYLYHLRHRVDPGLLWAGLAALLVSMSGVVLAANAIVFLVTWELMAISSFALVAADHEQHSVRHAALVYLGATRAGTAFLMGGFLWAHQLTGSWEFSQWSFASAKALGPALLIFVGLATKAGCWPFHLWLPIAHPAAPAPVSAVMSGVMIKTAIYAVLRFFLAGGLTPPALGAVALGLGAVTALWGVLFALLQRDLKRLLAYSSVENVGLLLMGIGLALVARQLGLPRVAELAIAAVLLHTLNHALFKALLFLGAGVVDAAAHTRDLERMGGLLRRLPWTGSCFLFGAASICGLVPLNGFIGEWFLYRGLFGLAAAPLPPALRLLGLLLTGWLAIVGGLVLATFARAVGIGFLGRPRQPAAGRARERDGGMVGAQLLLAALCAGVALFAQPVLGAMAPVRRQLLDVGGPGAPLAPPATLVPIALTLLVGSLLLAAWSRRSAAARPMRPYITWECGFGELGPRTQYTATSFAQPIARMFGGIYRYSQELRLEGRDRRHFPETVSVHPTYEPYLETRVYAPLVGLLQRMSATLLGRLQAGSIHQYLLSMMVALGVLLWLGFRS